MLHIPTSSTLNLFTITADINQYTELLLKRLKFIQQQNKKEPDPFWSSFISINSKLLTESKHKEAFYKGLNDLKSKNTPVLIKSGTSLFIYSDESGNGKWLIRKIKDDEKKIVKNLIHLMNEHGLCEKNVFSITNNILGTEFSRFMTKIVKENHNYDFLKKNVSQEKQQTILKEEIMALESLKVSLIDFEGVKNPENIKKNAPENINQIDLINEKINKLKQIIELTSIAADKLFKKIENAKSIYNKIQNKTLLNTVNHFLKSVVDNTKNLLVKIETWDKNFFLSQSIFEMANALQARFIPVNQWMDPFNTQETITQYNTHNISSYGHIMQWKNEVKKKGAYSLHPIMDLEVSREQQNYLQMLGKEDINIRCHIEGEIRYSIDFLISKLKTNSIYRFNLFPHYQHAKAGGHSMGIRKFENGEIEFFDPNYGLFVFSDVKSFKIWMNKLLLDYFVANKIYSSGENKVRIGFNMTVTEIGIQPKHSTPSIPNITPAPLDETEVKILEQSIKRKMTTLQRGFSIENIVINRPNHLDDLSYKKRLVHEINKEITRLQNVIIGDTHRRIEALKALQSWVNEASPHVPLRSMIQSWLASRPKEGSETYKTMIESYRMIGKSNTATFINKLSLTREISSSHLFALQAKLMDSILDIYLLKKDSAKTKTSLSIFTNIAQGFHRQTINIDELLLATKMRTGTNYTGLFTTPQNTQDRQANAFMRLIKNVDLYNPQSLIETTFLLKELSEQMKNESVNNESFRRINSAPRVNSYP